jgi:hypothetical protein
MNCQQYIFLIVEAAHGQLMDAAARDDAARHVETCAACAARLGQERNLTSALRTVAAGMKDLCAPERVETNLLAAFQQNLAVSRAATANALPDATATPAPGARASRGGTASRRQPWRAAAVATAIAASLALVALVTLYRQFTQSAPPGGITTNIAARVGAEPSPVAAASSAIPSPPLPLAASPLTPAAFAAPARQARRDGSQPAERAVAARASLKLARAATPKMIASRQVIDGGSAIFAAGDGDASANHAGSATRPNEAESVTEFIPLVAGAPSATPLESGQLVRVQLPRAALASLGLPLNAERGNEPVKADVLLGNDGLAHAIRFVR